jgi:peptidoglycan/LPS O-acetylase OafA/YrhL
MNQAASSDRRLPLLDGIRAVAITFVLGGHLLTGTDHHVWGVQLGSFGVSIFFVLSGFLITRSMLMDEDRRGRLSLTRFYFRRILRIFPVFYSFLLVLAILSLAGVLPQPDTQTWLASGIYFRNFTGSGWETSHLWSLALEEQFYLVWPVLFILTRNRRLAFIGGALALFIVRRAVWIYGHHGIPLVIADPGGLYWRPDLRLDTFLIGGAFAIADWRWVRTAPVYLGVPILWAWVPRAADSPWLQPVDTVMTAIILATMIAWLLANPGNQVSRLLSHAAPVRIGILSYSVYLWQQLFLGPHTRWWSIPATIVTAVASYALIEQPFLRLRHGAWAPHADPRIATTHVA